MSFLTKLFVVIHVVLTLLFVSAAIVFVNRVENFKSTNTALNAQLNTSKQAEQTARNEAQAARDERVAVQQQASDELGRMRQELNTAQAGNLDRDKQLAQVQQNLASADARAQAATSALETAQKTNGMLTDQLNQTREAADKTQVQNTELQTAIADKNQRLEVALRQLRNSNEEIEDLRNQVASGGGAAPAGAPVAGTAPTPNPNELAVTGEVRDRRNVNGVNYATISVGSADNVRKGMVFNVVEKGGQGRFLGYLTVDRVEQREASGKLEGPNVADIKPKDEVRTQL